jgi:hypothetical protein
MTPYNRKLQSALISAGKDVEGIKHTPTVADMEDKLERLKAAIETGDMRMMRKYGREVCAYVMKFMVERL